MWHISVSVGLGLAAAAAVVAAPTPAQPKLLRRLTPGANVIPLSRTNSITDLATGQFNETFCMAHMTYLERKQYANAMAVRLTSSIKYRSSLYYKNTGELHPDLNVSVEQLKTTHARLFRRQAGSNNTITLTDIGPDLLWSGPVQSSTSANTGNNFQISFGDGSSVRANVLTDVVSIGGLAITNSGVGAVTQLSQSFTNAGGDTSDGLMGLAFPILAESKQTPYFTNLAKLSPTQGMMSFKFVGKNAPGSEMTVGGMDTAAFTGHASQFATIDTGTSVVIAPQADAQAIYAAIPGSKLGQNGLFSYPCNANPDVALSFAGQNFNIKAADMSLGSDATNTTCVGAIVPSAQRNAWLVGDTFLKNVYTVFDQTNLQVGFAKLA
ncbi:hypothetical protein FRC11_011340 [Ceratobasidium sp. 423]|nr:hypothetical protein FRC11_011340 [Ceratobasidium sp. 423]